MFYERCRTYHPTTYIYPFARALGGTRQDIGSEASIPMLMNIPLMLEYLDWRLSCGGDGILQKNLFTTLQCVEYVAMLRVLSILHISVALPLRWLAGNVQDLEEYGFGVLDMGWTVDLMEAAFEEIAKDGSKLLDEDFMMNIFKEIIDKVALFRDYLQFMFEEKQSSPVGSRWEEDKVLPFDELRAAVFYPTRSDIRQTHDTACRLAEEAALVFLLEFRDLTKATSSYLSSIDGIMSMKCTSKEDRIACRGKDASNSIAESLHAQSTVGLRTCGTARLDYMAAEGQTRSNNDFGRCPELYVTGKSAKSKTIEYILGTFHTWPEELQQSIVQAGKEQAPQMRQRFNEALAAQEEARRLKEEIRLRHRLDATREEYIVAIYFWEQYHSPRCWRTAAEARDQFGQLKSKAKKLKAVKEQILIRYLGLGWERAYHPWSKGGVVFSPDELFEFLIDTVIPLAKELKVPKEPPMNMPEPPAMKTLGTTSDLALEIRAAKQQQREGIKAEAKSEIETREAEGKGDRWSERQKIVMPKIKTLKGFKIEMLFDYTEPDGSVVMTWCHGIVDSVVNADSGVVKIKWDKESLRDGDPAVTKDKLLESKYNPEKPMKGAWREYITQLRK